jgi:hypothetical protein
MNSIWVLPDVAELLVDRPPNPDEVADRGIERWTPGIAVVDEQTVGGRRIAVTETVLDEEPAQLRALLQINGDDSFGDDNVAIQRTARSTPLDLRDRREGITAVAVAVCSRGQWRQHRQQREHDSPNGNSSRSFVE